MRLREPGLAVLAAVMLSACATSALDMAPPSPDQPWVPVTTSTGEIVAGAPASSAPAEAGYTLPPNQALTLPVDPAEPVPDQDKAYTLPDLIDLAESSNPATRVAWNDARKAALAAGIAESAYLPRLAATALTGYQHSSGHRALDDAGASDRGSVHGSVAALSLQWLLFDFGQRDAVVEAAKQASVISNIAFTAAHQQVIHAVSVAFYAHAAARARERTAMQALENAKRVEEAAQARYRHGIGTVLEVAQARQGVAAAELARVRATGAVDDAYVGLIVAVGIPPTRKLRVADLPERPLSRDMAAPLDKLIAEALSRRPDLLGAYAAIKASEANVRAARAEFKPKIFLTTTGAYVDGGLDVTALPSAGQQPPTVNLSGHRFNSSIFVGATVPIYDGGTRSATLARARAEADSAEARMEQARNEAIREVVAADSSLRTSLAACDAAEVLAEAAQTTFDAAMAAYRHDVGTITDVALAEDQLLQARNARSDARSAALTAAASLALSTGALGAAP